ncbi:hypothetical protein [Formosa haliotis]|uniref:hypothetical protein n=1 Tax=Formosa haliotis TaxID=1555194 RepID=UPI000824E154|nr:hypothetical protein [Formosa haliotis]
MKKLTQLLTIFMTSIVFAQEDNNILHKDSVPLTKKEFYTAVKQDFSSLVGNDEKSINNSITTNFDKNETSVSAKFLIAPNYLNKNDKFMHLISGQIKIGESTNFLDLGKSKMPLIDLSVQYNWIMNKTWYFNKSSKTEKNNIKKIIIANDSLMKDEKKLLYYQIIEENEKNKIHNWTFKKYHWMSFEINYTNAKYQIFDITKPFDEQLFSEKYSKGSGSIGYNYYGKWIKDNIYWKDKVRPHYVFFTVNYEFKDGNNINKFEKIEITDYEQIEENNIIREVSTTRTAYKGNYKTFKQHNFSSELLIGIQKNISIDLFGNIEISKEFSPIYTYGGGLYFLAKNKKEETTVNLGIFIKKEGAKDPFLGFKTSLPISL